MRLLTKNLAVRFVCCAKSVLWRHLRVVQEGYWLPDDFGISSFLEARCVRDCISIGVYIELAPRSVK
jgi:hypothetical protein